MLHVILENTLYHTTCSLSPEYLNHAPRQLIQEEAMLAYMYIIFDEDPGTNQTQKYPINFIYESNTK